MIYKKYINIITYVDKNGKTMPLMILWDNGEKYSIDRIIHVGNAASKVGGCGVLYQCKIKGQIKNLFYEIDRWFIEANKK